MCARPHFGGAFATFGPGLSVPAVTIPATYVLGGTMRRTTVTALLAAVALALGGCSSSSDGDKPEPTATATVTKGLELSAAEQRTACVDAWAALLQEDVGAGIEDAPVECGAVPEGDRLDVYMEGLQRRNQANRDEVAECVDDPSCTSVPIP